MEERSLFERCEDVSKNWTFRMPMMAMEECGELIQAISKFERSSEFRETMTSNDGKFVWNGPQIENVIEEMADVFISCSALCHQYGISEEDIVEEIEKRLYRRLAWNRDEKRETKAMLALNDTLKTFPDLDVEALAAYEFCQDMDIVSISADGANNLFVTLR